MKHLCTLFICSMILSFGTLYSQSNKKQIKQDNKLLKNTDPYNKQQTKQDDKILKDLGLDYWKCDQNLFSKIAALGDTLQTDSIQYLSLSGLNPFLFTSFLERREGYKLEMENDLFNYRYSKYYIKPSSKILINFNQCFLKDFNAYVDVQKESISNQLGSLFPNKDSITEVITNENLNMKIEISAYIKTVQGNVIPITVYGYFDVIKNAHTTSGMFLYSNPDSTQDNMNVTYNYTRRIQNELVETEIDLNNYSFVNGDQVIVIVKNVGGVGKGVAYTMTFEIESQGWQSGPSSQLAFIKSKGSNDINFEVGVAMGYSFYKKPRLGKHSFTQHLLAPSFGPHLIAFNDNTAGSNNLRLGLGGNMSILYRTVTVGYGGLLNYPGNFKERQYFYVGLNFIEGIQAVKSSLITKTSSNNSIGGGL